MFDSSKYASQAVMETVSLDIQMHLWKLIEAKRSDGHDLHSVQQFRLSAAGRKKSRALQIIHSQGGGAPFADKHRFAAAVHYRGTIWITDTGDYAIMMFPHEWPKLIKQPLPADMIREKAPGADSQGLLIREE